MTKTLTGLDPEVQKALRDLQQQIDTLTGPRNVDFGGRRIINAGRAIDPLDYVTKNDLDRALHGVTQGTMPAALTGGPADPVPVPILVGTHAERLARAPVLVPKGTIFFETDRTVYYMAVPVAGVNAWQYVGGVMATVPGDISVSGAPTPPSQPGAPSAPFPANGASGVSLTPILTWTA